MFATLNQIVEQRIADSMRNGDFDDLPGQGQPLVLDDDALVPEELRAAYRILKNAGYLPPEVQALRDLNSLLGSALVHENSDPADQLAARRLLAVTLALEARGVHLSTQAAVEYHRGIAGRLAGERSNPRSLADDKAAPGGQEQSILRKR
jgi:hypothetical protein